MDSPALVVGVSGASNSDGADVINANPNNTTGNGLLADLWDFVCLTKPGAQGCRPGHGSRGRHEADLPVNSAGVQAIHAALGQMWNQAPARFSVRLSR